MGDMRGWHGTRTHKQYRHDVRICVIVYRQCERIASLTSQRNYCLPFKSSQTPTKILPSAIWPINMSLSCVALVALCIDSTCNFIINLSITNHLRCIRTFQLTISDVRGGRRWGWKGRWWRRGVDGVRRREFRSYLVDGGYCVVGICRHGIRR